MKKCSKCGCELISGNTIPASRYKRGSLECGKCERERIVASQQLKYKMIGEYKTERGCDKCGYKDHACALDFHHVKPNGKVKRVSRMIDDNYSLSSIFKEIEKCIILCANCHRVHHKKERDQKD